MNFILIKNKFNYVEINLFKLVPTNDGADFAGA